mmetsp:Transcript_13427/g.34387  ORF Transcript_13427/g.34387 Transcript_13427/m.34387 type:complete len:146 (+) Transcript_13427:87-524(+)|eukprot:CAMPEP_0206289938 /NCGR_PEP_ID=MMETSP0106_2-20121207/2368_1 /ASSEMBLY_ACC=CAM_ASM_000206 /TAXON_ID=81532 /ORGANISM="Acanthoeca-like sp., Strain 10tr" /LENGTH=145 /DNA_ID=CAMNT_0053720495 /DNA_START=25 /DNA_END=462 /DNA_ORIENTATION=-
MLAVPLRRLDVARAVAVGRIVGGSSSRFGKGQARRLGHHELHCIADVCVVPLGAARSPSVGGLVAKAVKLIQDHPGELITHTHSYGTNVEGEMEDVLDAVRACHEMLHAEGVPRLSTTLKLGTRTDKHASINDKLARVTEELAKL